MVRALGIDPGTGSWDVLGLKDGGEVFMDVSIPTKKVMKDAEMLISLLEKNQPWDMIVAPSGHGIPLKPISEVTDEDILKATLRKQKDPKIMGIGRILSLMRERDIKGYVVPGVKQLGTVPSHFKYNKIDMGTADKVCCVAACIVDQANRLSIPWEKTSFIMVEIGYGFNALVAVENGKIIDGIGGSLGGMGFRAPGCLDGELAYLLDHISKKVIYSGGVTTVAGYPDLDPKELFLLAKKDKHVSDALDGFMHDLVKGIISLIPSFKNPQVIKEIVISGRATNQIRNVLEKSIPRVFQLPIEIVGSIARISKTAAQGAALLANGLASGRYNALIDVMDLGNSNFDILGNLYVGNINLNE